MTSVVKIRYCANCDVQIRWRGPRWCKDCLRMILKTVFTEAIALATVGILRLLWSRL